MNIRLCIAALLLLPPAAFAQGNPGPFGGLFGRTPERTGNAFTAVDFRAGVAGQYDDALLVDQALPDDEVPRSGYTSGVNAGLAFEQQSDRFLISARGGATYQEFYRDPVFGSTQYDAAVRSRGNVTTRLELEGQANYLRTPFYRLVPNYMAAGPPVTIPSDPTIVRLLLNETYDVSGGFTSKYAKHSSLSASVGRRETRFLSGRGNDYDVLRADAHWRRQLNRKFALRAGYGRERIFQSAFPDAEYIHELIDLGVDFSTQLSVSERSSLGVNTQTSVIKRPTTGRRYRLNGNVTFSKYFGKTGHLTASVSRNTEFLPGFLEPLMSDAAAGSISGMLSKRWDWYTNISAGRGRYGFDSPDDFATAQLTSRMNFALTPRLGFYGQYAAYYYQLPPTPTSMILLGQVSRQALTFGFNTWVPIVNRVRAPRDPE